MADDGLYSINPGETPQAVSSRRKLAEALLMQGMSTEPIRSGWQGAANLAKALMGGYGMYQADQEDAAGLAKAMRMYSAGMGLGGDNTAPSLPSVPSISPNAPVAPDVPLPNKPLRSVPLDAQRPPQDAIRAALTGPGAGPALVAPTGWQRPETAMAATGQSSPAPASRGPNPALVSALVNPYLPKPLQELAMTKAKEQMKPDEWTHFTAGDKNMVYNKTNPGVVRDLGAGSENKFGNVAELRKEIHQLPSYQNWTKRVDPTIRSMVDSMHTDSKASDVNLVYGMATIFDPNSVVREGEQVIIRSTASLPEWLIGSINGLNGGQRLGPETRAALMKEAMSRAKEHYDALQNDLSPYGGIAQHFGMRPEHVVPPIRPLPQIKAPPTAAPPSQGAPAQPPARPAPPGVDPKIWAVMTPQEQALWK